MQLISEAISEAIRAHFEFQTGTLKKFSALLPPEDATLCSDAIFMVYMTTLCSLTPELKENALGECLDLIEKSTKFQGTKELTEAAKEVHSFAIKDKTGDYLLKLQIMAELNEKFYDRANGILQETPKG